MSEPLQLAVNLIMANEPGDSRAVSDEAVALAAIACGDTSPEVMAVIRAALAATAPEPTDGQKLRNLANVFNAEIEKVAAPVASEREALRDQVARTIWLYRAGYEGSEDQLRESTAGRECFELTDHILTALAAPPSQAADSVRHAFRAADNIDWEHLDQFIPQSGHGRFWRAVFQEVRAALSDAGGRR